MSERLRYLTATLHRGVLKIIMTVCQLLLVVILTDDWNDMHDMTVRVTLRVYWYTMTDQSAVGV